MEPTYSGDQHRERCRCWPQRSNSHVGCWTQACCKSRNSTSSCSIEVVVFCTRLFTQTLIFWVFHPEVWRMGIWGSRKSIIRFQLHNPEVKIWQYSKGYSKAAPPHTHTHSCIHKHAKKWFQMFSHKKYPNVNFGSILGSNVPFYLFLYIMSNGKICCVIEAIEKINTGRGHLCVWPWCRCCSTPGSAKTAQLPVPCY